MDPRRRVSCRRRASGMHDRQIEEPFERIEIAITMQQRVLFPNAERRDEKVDGLAHGAAAAAQETIVSRSVPRQFDTASLEYLQFEQLPLDSDGRTFIAQALQHLAQNDVGETQPSPAEFAIEPLGFWIADGSEIVDPDRRVDDDHVGYLVARPRRD